MARNHTRLRPILEAIESRVLLSTDAGAATERMLLQLRGTMRWTFTLTTTQSDDLSTGDMVATEKFVGRLAPLGFTHASQRIVRHLTGGGDFVINPMTSGPLVLTTARGSVSLRLSAASDSKLPRYNYTILGGSNTYQGATGSGTITFIPKGIHRTGAMHGNTQTGSISELVRFTK